MQPVTAVKVRSKPGRGGQSVKQILLPFLLLANALARLSCVVYVLGVTCAQALLVSNIITASTYNTVHGVTGVRGGVDSNSPGILNSPVKQ